MSVVGTTIGFTVTADACGLGSYVLYDGSFGLGMGEMTTTPAFPSGTYSVSPEGPCPSLSIDLSKLLNEDNAEVVTYDEMDISIPPTGTSGVLSGLFSISNFGIVGAPSVTGNVNGTVDESNGLEVIRFSGTVTSLPSMTIQFLRNC